MSNDNNFGSESITVEYLYKCFGILADANEQAGNHENTYSIIINGTKAGNKEKILASQFISRFFKYFPKQMPVAIDAIFDLCEDEDVNIRRSAIKDLANISKECSIEHLNRIADILTQLLQTDDQFELQQVQASLLTLLRLNPKSTLDEMFNQINTSQLEQVRKRAIKFICNKLPLFIQASSPDNSIHDQNESLFKTATSTFLKRDFEDIIIKHVKQALNDVDAEEFTLFIRLLTSLPSMNNLQGRQDLINIIMAQSELDKQFDPNDVERIIILMSCIQQAIPLFSKNLHSTKYVNWLIENVLINYDQIATNDSIKFEILKSFADLCTYYQHNQTNSQNSQELLSIKIIYDLLIKYLPLPPNSNTEISQQYKIENREKEETKFNFSYVECLMYSFHKIARSNQDFLNSSENQDRLKDFRNRLQYFAKKTQNYIKELKNTLINTSSLAFNNESNNEEDKIRKVALKVTMNIDLLIKDFFYNPPSYKTSIILSWNSNQPIELQQKLKRSPIHDHYCSNISSSKIKNQCLQNQNLISSNSNKTSKDSFSLKKKPERGIYQPPSGKYSSTSTTPLNNNNTPVSNNNLIKIKHPHRKLVKSSHY